MIFGMTPPHIDVAAAGLLAQVLPTLLIFLVLEARIPKPSRTDGLWHRLNMFNRLAAIFINTGTTFICLWSVIQNDTNWGWTEFVDIVIVAGFLSLYFAIIAALGEMIFKGIRRAE